MTKRATCPVCDHPEHEMSCLGFVPLRGQEHLEDPYGSTCLCDHYMRDGERLGRDGKRLLPNVALGEHSTSNDPD